MKKNISKPELKLFIIILLSCISMLICNNANSQSSGNQNLQHLSINSTSDAINYISYGYAVSGCATVLSNEGLKFTSMKPKTRKWVSVLIGAASSFAIQSIREQATLNHGYEHSKQRIAYATSGGIAGSFTIYFLIRKEK